MSDRITVATNIVLDGHAYVATLFHNPTIEDVIIGEMRVAAYEVENGPLSEDPNDPSRLTPRDIRDYFIRMGIER